MNSTHVALHGGEMIPNTEILSIAREAIADEPEASDKQILQVVRQVAYGTDDDDNPVSLDMIKQAREELYAIWHKPYKEKTAEEHAAMSLSRTKWYRRQLQKGLGQEGAPSQSQLRADMRELFGSSASTDQLKELREEFLARTQEQEPAPVVTEPAPVVTEPSVTEPFWYEQKGVYSREGVEQEVSAGLDFYSSLHNTSVAKLSIWALDNQRGPATPPPVALGRYLEPLKGNQLRFGTVMRMAVPTILSAHAGRCYTGLTNSGFGAYVMRTVDTELSVRGITPMPVEEEGSSEPAESVEEPAAEEPAAEEPAAEEPETPQKPQHETTRMHPDDRAVLVADLRASLGMEKLLEFMEATAEDAKKTREAVEAQARDTHALVEGLETLATGLGRLSDAVVAIRRQTEGRPTVALDGESVSLLRGLETRILDNVSEGLKKIKVAPTLSGGSGGGEEDMVRRLLDEGRSFKLEVGEKVSG